MYQIYHNPRCSKSRQTLKILREKGIEPEIILYLENPLKISDLKNIITKLGLESAKDLLRKGEPNYKELGLKTETSELKIMEAMSRFPKLIERPIVVKGDQAVIGRPPARVLELV